MLTSRLPTSVMRYLRNMPMQIDFVNEHFDGSQFPRTFVINGAVMLPCVDRVFGGQYIPLS